MTVCRNDDQWDRSNVLFAGRPHRRLRQRGRERRTCGTSTTGLASCARQRLARSRRRRRSTWPRSISGCSPRGELAAYEVPAASTKSARPRASTETRAYLSRERRRRHDELRTAAPRRGDARSSPSSTRRGSSGWSVLLADLRARGGRLFFLGVGGSAANCSHAVNDFRKIAGIEAYTPTDNVSELTARTNDEGWETVFVEWLQRQPTAARRTWCSCCRSAAAASSRTSARISCARCSSPERSAPRSSASSDATADTPRKSPTRASIVPTVNPDNDHAACRGVPGGRLAFARLASGCSRRRTTKWESTAPFGRAVFLDRDGVINRAMVRDGKPYPPATRRGARNPPGRRLTRWRACATAGFRLVVVTNQPDVARGTQRREVVEPCTRGSAPHCPLTSSASAIMTMRTTASAASRARCC